MFNNQTESINVLIPNGVHNTRILEYVITLNSHHQSVLVSY